MNTSLIQHRINCSSAGHDSSVPKFFNSLKISKDCILYDLVMVILTNQQETGLKNFHNTYILGDASGGTSSSFFEFWLGKNQLQKILLKKYYE